MHVMTLTCRRRHVRVAIYRRDHVMAAVIPQYSFKFHHWWV